MGVSRRAPGWLTWVLSVGLALVFLGERVLSGAPGPRLVASGLGVFFVLASAAWRMASWRQARAASPEEAGVEARLALAYAGCVLALILYFLSTNTGLTLLGAPADEAARGHYRTPLQVAWTVVMAISFLPAFVAGLAPGVRRGEGSGGLLEAARVDDAYHAGLVIALAATLLFVVGFVATAQDRSVDLGYFRTSAPGTATRALVRALRTPLHVVLFFPDASPVKGEVEDYFHALGRAGGHVTLESHDPLLDPEAARRYDVGLNGAVVLDANGQKTGWPIPVEMDQARRQLRTLDGEVQYRLGKLLRGERVAYLTVGHGELNDTSVAMMPDEKRLGGVDAMRSLFTVMNYQARDLGLASGLGRDVPADASMVLVLGPRRAFLPEELAALDRYVARGGSILLALPARSAFRLGPLEQRLGLRFDGVPVADDQQYVRRSGDISDRGLLVSNAFTYHESDKTAASSDSSGVALFPDPSRLELIDSTSTRARVLVRALPTAFLDRNGNYQPDGPQEPRGAYTLGAAVKIDSARALVYADAEMFTDAVLPNLRVNASLAADGVRWLGREEALAGTTSSEEDVPIEHTRAQDVAWFYSTILGAPALILAFGLVGVRRRRRTGGAV